MPRGRTASPPAQAVDVKVNNEALQEASQAATALVLAEEAVDSRVRAVAQQLGYQLPAGSPSPDLIMRDIAANMRRSVEAVLEVGRALRVLKEACGHGNFLQRLEALNIEHSVAKRFMQSAVKFSSNGASTHHLLEAAGNQTKLFELLVLDDEEIEELEQTGETRELALDDIASMSVKELRKTLRERTQDLEAKDKVIKAKGEHIDKLQEQVSRPFKPREGSLAKTQEEQSILDELQATVLALNASIAAMLLAADAAMKHRKEALQLAGRQAVDLACQQLVDAAEEHGIAINLDERVQPAWLDLGAVDKLAARNASKGKH